MVGWTEGILISVAVFVYPLFSVQLGYLYLEIPLFTTLIGALFLQLQRRLNWLVLLVALGPFVKTAGLLVGILCGIVEFTSYKKSQKNCLEL